jgi:hypothetical protein
MSEIFDTAPFAYVGENVHYKELTSEEKEKLKELRHKSEIKKEANPSSEEVSESSAAVVGQLLPQIPLTDNEVPDFDNLMADADEESILFREALCDEITGDSMYFEAAGFMDKLKELFKNNKEESDKAKIEKAAKAYVALRMAGSRLRVMTAQNPESKQTSKYRELQRKVISAEKEYRKIKNGLSKDAITTLNEYITEVDAFITKSVDKQLKDIADARKASSLKKEESVKDIVIEKAIDSDMKPIIDKLNAKGYKTKASSSGHNNLVRKDDRNKNGVLDEHLYNDARVVFDGKYDFGKAPKYWYWKKVDNADEVEYLDIEQIKYTTQSGGPSNAFQDWKRKYMKSLEDWADSLPNVSDKTNNVKTESEEIKSFNELNDEIDTLFESVLGDMFIDVSDM